MQFHVIGVDVTDLQVKGFRQAKAHAVYDENVALKPCRPGSIDHGRKFVIGQDVGKFLLHRWFDDIHPVPFTFQNMFVKQLKATSIAFNSGPGVSQDKRVEVIFKLFRGEAIWAAVEVFANTSYCSRIGVNSRFRLALAAKRVNMLFIE